MGGWDQDGGGGGGTSDHDSLTGVSADDHHTENHAARHATAGADPLAPDDIGAATSGHTHDATLSLNRQTASYTFVLTDVGKLVYHDNTSAATFTVPNDSTVAWPTGAVIHVMQYNTGALTVAAGTSVNLHGPIALPNTNRTLAGRYCQASLVKVAANTWVLTGDLD